VAGKYYVPELGAFLIYLVMVVLLMWRPLDCSGGDDAGHRGFAARLSGAPGALELDRGRVLGGDLAAVLADAELPGAGQPDRHHGAFALSLDLILGYAGIVSLGHAAFFGLGAYAAGLAAKHGWGEPITGLMLGRSSPASSVTRRAFIRLALPPSRADHDHARMGLL